MQLVVYSIQAVRTRLHRVGGALLFAGGIAIAVAAHVPAQTPPAATATGGAIPAKGTPAAEAAEIVWAREIDPETNAPVRRATAFITTDAAIYAVLSLDRVEQGSVVEASWFYDGTPVPSLTASVAVDKTYEESWIEFHLTLPEGQIWPTGEYTIAIAVNGQQIAESAIEVTVPPS